MSTNPYFFKTVAVTATSFSTNADCAFPFQSNSLMVANYGIDGYSVVEFSFDGVNLHGELNPTTPTRGMAMDNIAVKNIWFRIKSGSTGPVEVLAYAWQRFYSGGS